MQRNPKEISAKGILLLFLVVITAIALRMGLVNNEVWYNIVFITLPAMLILMLPVKSKVEKKKEIV